MAREDPEHVQQIIDEGKFNRRPASTSTLRSNCKSGFRFTQISRKSGNEVSKRQTQFHHILPIETLGDDSITDTEQLDFFHNCMAITKWDINEEHNLIGLPTRRVYEKAELDSPDDAEKRAGKVISAARNAAALAGTFGHTPDLPCHEISHNPDYNQGVIDYLNKHVWDQLPKKKKKCEVDPHKLREFLEAAADKWRTFLVDRGKERGGASHCWVNRNENGYDKYWYIPFSMKPGTPLKVDPPPPLNKRSGTIKEWLSLLIPA